MDTYIAYLRLPDGTINRVETNDPRLKDRKFVAELYGSELVTKADYDRSLLGPTAHYNEAMTARAALLESTVGVSQRAKAEK